MKIGVITYDVPHKKTQDVLFRLKAHGYNDVECVALPFMERRKFTPLIRHRMVNELPVDPETFCNRLGYSYTTDMNLDRYDKVIIGGANILPKEIIGKHEIINAHPGYLPFVRGLDSLKWAILEGSPIGVTTHVINEEIDGGTLIEQNFISIDYFDTIHSLGYKTYSLELDMLIDAITNPYRRLLGKGSTPKRRMSHKLEVKMIAKLEILKTQSL
ncbi:hypothetical protein KAR91_26285 [Candidatus Pacearchaeota archaeon]|nr:hypothetical protein [Candidatus Pacearchaeota archaeon]